VSITLTDRIVDPDDEGFDIALYPVLVPRPLLETASA